MIDHLIQFIKDKRKLAYLGTIPVVFSILLFTHGYNRPYSDSSDNEIPVSGSPNYIIKKGDLGYKKITIDEAFAHFSFDYPFNWYDLSVNQWTSEEVSVLIMHNVIGELHQDFSILVKVDATGDKTVESELARIKSFRGGQVLDQSEFTFNGDTGGQLQLIYYDEFFDQEYRVPTYLWLVIFEKDELQYFIQIQSDEELMKKAKGYFIHLLDSFRIVIDQERL